MTEYIYQSEALYADGFDGSCNVTCWTTHLKTLVGPCPRPPTYSAFVEAGGSAIRSYVAFTMHFSANFTGPSSYRSFTSTPHSYCLSTNFARQATR